MTYGMLIDLKKCVGCHACSVACKEAHGTRPGVRRSRVDRVFEGTYPDVRKTAYPMLCMHCETAPCVEVCPQDATYKREDGIVVIDKDKCIGCGSCQTVCPYDARHLAASEDGYFGSELSEYEAVMYETMPRAFNKGVPVVHLIPGQTPDRLDHICSAFDQCVRVKIEKIA